MLQCCVGMVRDRGSRCQAVLSRPLWVAAEDGRRALCRPEVGALPAGGRSPHQVTQLAGHVGCICFHLCVVGPVVAASKSVNREVGSLGGDMVTSVRKQLPF